MKNGIWKIAAPCAQAVGRLSVAGYAQLTARVLSSRGYDTPQAAAALLDDQAELIDPLRMKDMECAVQVIRSALERRTRIAVFGDYDVDGITATCLLVDYLRGRGADCVAHIPGRLEEGYGLNEGAIRQLHADGVGLIITVDCGITAVEEAQLCKALGMALIVTDHHECKAQLPRAQAVVNPHRPDDSYPHQNLSGVGVAFKLAAALEGDQARIAARYCDLVCLGTIADVMPLLGENRRLVVMGLAAMQNSTRVGLRALIACCGCCVQPITATTIGYVLAPRINAAGRMEHAELAVQLFLSEDPQEAAQLAEVLCRLNRERQETELKIYREATERLRTECRTDSAIVLAGEQWHQGVVGIVASRLSEEFCRPTFLICLNGEHGKASSRSWGGFNLFASLSELSPLLEGYGGHELAAGFTILRSNIEAFRQGVCSRASAYAASGAAQSALQIDCEVEGALLTEQEIQGLQALEPCGTGCPRPVFCMLETTIEQISAVGGGKHLRLRLQARDGTSLPAIYFSAGALAQRLVPGDRVDVAFHAQMNEYRGLRTVQLNLIDLHPVSPTALLERFRAQVPMEPWERSALTPTRADVVDVWNYLCGILPEGRSLRCGLTELGCAISQGTHGRHSLRRTLPCLEILAELGFIQLRRRAELVELSLSAQRRRNPLENSSLYRSLRDGQSTL